MYIKYNNSKLDWSTIITKVDQKEIKKKKTTLTSPRTVWMQREPLKCKSFYWQQSMTLLGVLVFCTSYSVCLIMNFMSFCTLSLDILAGEIIHVKYLSYCSLNHRCIICPYNPKTKLYSSVLNLRTHLHDVLACHFLLSLLPFLMENYYHSLKNQ